MCRFAPPFDTGNGPRFNANCPTLPKHTPALCDSAAASGPTEAGIYEAVRLTIMGRSCTMDVLEVPDTVPVLIGQIPLEHLDFVVDLRDQKLIGNPRHNGEHVYEMF